MLDPVSLSNKSISTGNIYLNNNPEQIVKVSGNTSFTGVRNKKIGFKEGAGIFFNGMAKQCVEILNSIIEHPVKTIAIVGGTTLGLLALPFIGIPTAVAGGALAIGFAGYAIGKGTYHAVQFANNNKRGTYHLARKNLEQIGEDTIDIALSVPFTPKAAVRMQNFMKYGKVGINHTLIDTLKSEKSFIDKFRALKNFDKNMTRSLNYQSNVDKEISKLTSATEAEKAALKKEMLDYNVPKEKISEVVLEKWAQKRGIETKPEIFYATLGDKTGGVAIIKDCSMVLNDFKHKIPESMFSKYKQISAKLVNGEYEISYKNLQTGEIVKDTIKKDILDKYNALFGQCAKLSPESKQILVTLHEREHIDQYARIFSLKGFNWKPVSDKGKLLYQKMINDMPVVQAGSAEAQHIEALANAQNISTPVSYIKNLREIEARNAEWNMLGNSDFYKLDNVFAKTGKMNPPALKETILLNALRPESASS